MEGKKDRKKEEDQKSRKKNYGILKIDFMTLNCKIKSLKGL